VINSGPLKLFAPLGEGLLKPLYDDYSFANIPHTIEYLLTGERPGPLLPPDCFGGAYPSPRKVVLFFIDSFGWSYWRRHAIRYRSTRRVLHHGVLTPISALFPSTTAAAVSTLNYGVLPAVHALYEWNIYIPAYGEVIQSLPFCSLGVRVRDGGVAKGYNPQRLLAVKETIHQRLGRRGVRSIQFAHRDYADSVYNIMAQAGAEVVRHRTLAEALVQLKQAVTETADKAWLSLYWAGIDSIGHVYGPNTPHHDAEIASFWRTFDEVFRDVNSPDTLYLFTADHGCHYSDAKQTIAINEQTPEIVGLLRKSPSGEIIRPNGSGRDMFLHIEPGCLDQALSLLHRHYDDVALIMPMEEVLEQGLFGPVPVGEEMRRRLGDVLVLPYPGRFVWWREPGVLENHYYGLHGGLAPDELITVLGVTDAL
jgi:predicted AlkP superfamily pyrophosphatase or phosphodiesterase